MNPFLYQKDCYKIVNRFVDHCPYKLYEANRPLSQRYWKENYPDIPFHIDLKNVAPPLIDATYSLPCYRDKKFLQKATQRYHKMLKVKKEHPNIFVVPCYDNDLIWHTHQQFSLAYQEDTSSMLGKMLDHNDATND